MADEQKPEDQPKNLVDASNEPVSDTEQEHNQAAEEFQSQKGADGQLTMNVRVRSPFKSYYDGPAFSISGENATGPFDILPRHHNFISLLSPCDLVVRSTKGDEKIQIAGGIMHVKADQVIVFLDV